MSIKDTKPYLLPLINRIYESTSRQDLLSLIHQSLQDPFGLGPVAALIPFDSEDGHYQMNGFAGIPFNNGDKGVPNASQWIEDWLVYYSKLDPLARAIYKDANHRALRYTDVLSRDDHLGSSFHREFLAKIPITWVLALPLFYSGQYRGMIWLTREKENREFSDLEGSIATMISHHAANAIQLLDWQSSPPLAQNLGILVLDESNRIVFQNEKAEALLHEMGMKWALGEGDHKVNLHYLHSSHGTFKIRTVLLRRATEGSDIPALNDSPGRAILTEPYPPRILPHQRMKELDLSKRQSQIVLEIMGGKTNKEIAQKLEVTPQTIKDHLHSIFRQLDVRNRSELIIKVMGGSPPFTEIA